MGFRRIGRWQRDLTDLVVEFEAARLACEEAKREREIVKISLRRNSKAMVEMFEEFWAASGPFIDLGSLDFVFAAGGATGAAMTEYVGDTRKDYDEFGYSNQ